MGCEACQHTGRLGVSRCVGRCSREYAELLRAFWASRDGLYPAAGGLVDQTNAFLEAKGILDAEFRRLTRKPKG